MLKNLAGRDPTKLHDRHPLLIEEMAPSKILVIGATGLTGRYVTMASVKLCHPTFVFVRSASPSDPAKAELLKSFQDAGVKVLVGSLSEHESLVAALKQVDAVISTVGQELTTSQVNILAAAKEVGGIKRFVPAEYGLDVDKAPRFHPITNAIFNNKQGIRRAAEASGIPYTIVQATCFFSYFLASLQQDQFDMPRDGKLLIFGDGNAKAIILDEHDIATFIVKCVDDPRTENKILRITPKGNIASQNDMTSLWEKKIGRTFEKEFLDADSVLKSIDTVHPGWQMVRALKYAMFVLGEGTKYPLDTATEVEATELWPDVKTTSIDEYFDSIL